MIWKKEVGIDYKIEDFFRMMVNLNTLYKNSALESSVSDTVG